MIQHGPHTSSVIRQRRRPIILPVNLLVLGVMLLLSSSAGAATWSPKYPVEDTYSGLHGISCATAEFCMSGGLHYTTEPYIAYVEKWNGTKWTAQSLPLPAAADSSIAGGASCPSTTTCMVVGIYHDKNTNQNLPLAELWNGTSWILQSVPVAENTQYASLEGISCASTTECVAVGMYTKEKNLGGVQPYIVKWNGTKWIRQVASLPTSGAGGLLRGISCTSNSACVAVGSYYSLEIIEEKGKEIEVEVNEGSLVDTWNGSKWTGSHLSAETLSDVSCTSAENCMVVDEVLGQTWRFSESKWSETKELAPPEAIWTVPRGIECISANECVVVGAFEDSAERMFISLWDGSNWELQTSIEPAEGEYGLLLDVSCVKKITSCIAVGEIEAQSIAEHSK